MQWRLEFWFWYSIFWMLKQCYSFQCRIILRLKVCYKGCNGVLRSRMQCRILKSRELEFNIVCDMMQKYSHYKYSIINSNAISKLSVSREKWKWPIFHVNFVLKYLSIHDIEYAFIQSILLALTMSANRVVIHSPIYSFRTGKKLSAFKSSFLWYWCFMHSFIHSCIHYSGVHVFWWSGEHSRSQRIKDVNHLSQNSCKHLINIINKSTWLLAGGHCDDD